MRTRRIGCGLLNSIGAGSGKVLRGHVRKIDREAMVESISDIASLDNMGVVPV